MPTENEKVYTYRNGKKVYLKKEPDQFVVRRQPEELQRMGINGSFEKVSSASTRVTVSSNLVTPIMEQLRTDTVTHHAYTQQENNAEFLITDRIIVTFKNPPGNDVLSAFMTMYALLLRRKYSATEFLFQLYHSG